MTTNTHSTAFGLFLALFLFFTLLVIGFVACVALLDGVRM